MAAKIPDRLNITHEILKNSPPLSKIAVRGESSSLDWGGLKRKVESFASVLRDCYNVKKGDTVLVRAMNTPEIAISVLSTMGIGVVPCMTSRLYMKNEIEYALENSVAELGITPSEVALPLVKVKQETGRPTNLVSIGESIQGTDDFKQLLDRAHPIELSENVTQSEDPAFVMYTSGSTGVPKGVVHAHRWLLGSGRIVGSEMMDLTPEDVVYCPQEVSFLHGFAWGFVVPLYFGSSIVLIPTRSGAPPESFFEILEKFRVTVFVSVTTMFRNLMKVEGAERKFDLSSLRMCITGGDPLFPKEFDEWKSRFKIDLLETMAQTEIGIYTGYPKNAKVKPGSCGLPLGGHDLRIVDESGREVETGIVGHLVISGTDPGLFKEYMRMGNATRECKKDGWYYTKDMAYVDQNGYLWFAGRSDDMFKSRGYLISPQEIEKAIMEHPSVSEACVVPALDEKMGNRVKAFVCLKSDRGWDTEDFAEDLRKFLLQRIAAYKVPKDVEIIEEMPKTITGKIKRNQLRALSKSVST